MGKLCEGLRGGGGGAMGGEMVRKGTGMENVD
jgi:hypothetical protein